jgi:hypothetical protein
MDSARISLSKQRRIKMENTMTAADIQAQVTKIEAEAKPVIPENETQEEFIARVSYVNPYIKKLFEDGINAKTEAQFHDELEMFCSDNECDLSEHTDFKHHLPVTPSKPPKPYTVIDAAFAHRSDKDTRVALHGVKVEEGNIVATDGRRLFVAPYAELPDGLWDRVDKQYMFFFDGKTEDEVKAWIDDIVITKGGEGRNLAETRAINSVYRVDKETGKKSHYPRLIDGKWYHNYAIAEIYPNYKQVIPDDLSNTHKIENAERMLPYIESALKIYKLLPTKDDAVTIVLQGQMLYFNGMYLRDALRGLAGYGPVTMYIGGQIRPTTLKSGDALVVLMPMRGDKGDDYRTKPSGVIVNMPGWDKPSNMPTSPTKRNTITKTTKRTIYAVAKLVDKKMVVVTQDGAAGFDLPINIEQTEDESIEMFKNECHKYLVILGLADSIDLRITKGR